MRHGLAGDRLAVVSGPGGVGKGTVVRRLLERHPRLAVCVSMTTRAPREGEVDGTHYHFVDEATFDSMVAEDAFVEWASFAGHRYGTPWSSLDRALAAGQTVVLEIEIQGALQVREQAPEAVLIFLQPPSIDELLGRLRGRGTDDPDRIAERMSIAEWELDQSVYFDHVVVNDTVDNAAAAIARILGY